MSKSFVVNLGKGFERAYRDETAVSYKPFNTDSDLIIKGYMSVETFEDETLSGLIIKSEDLKKYLYDVLTETEKDGGLAIDAWSIHVDVVGGATPEERYLYIYLTDKGIS